MAPSILITTPILLPVVMKFGVDPVHFGMIMLMNLGIGLCHPPVGATLFVGCAVGRVRMEDVIRQIWPFYGVMFLVLMAVTYIPAISLWLPRALSLSDGALSFGRPNIEKLTVSVIIRRGGRSAAGARR